MRLFVTCLAVSALAGCVGNLPFMPAPAEPLDDVPRLSDVDLPEEAEAVAIAEPQAGNQPGFLARLLGRDDTNDPPPVDAAIAEALDDVEATPETDTNDTPEVTTAEAPRRGGLLGLFGGGSTGSADAATDDPDQVPPLTMQAFGEVGRTCGLSTRDLGTRVASVAGFEVYDTFPNSTTARPHYITGFSDRCARQFTAALVLTGDVGTHEVVRYQGSGRNLPFTQADEAYERIKGQFCGASRGQPCGGRLDALARNTTFITAYETFETSRKWAELLLHSGEVAAVSVETRN